MKVFGGIVLYVENDSVVWLEERQYEPVLLYTSYLIDVAVYHTNLWFEGLGLVKIVLWVRSASIV